MRVIRPLFTLVTLLLLISNSSFSQTLNAFLTSPEISDSQKNQILNEFLPESKISDSLSQLPSSIYHDSKVLADFLESTSAPVVHFNIGRWSNGKPIILQGEKKIESQNDRSLLHYSLPSYGTYYIQMSNPSSSDSIDIVLNNKVFHIKPITENTNESGTSIDSLDRITIGYYPTNTNIIISNYTKSYEIVGEDENGKPIIESFEDPPYSSFHQEGIDEIKYANILNILTAHTDFNSINSGVNWSFKNAQSKYRQNPFFSSIAINNSFLDTELDNYFDPQFFYINQENFSNFLHNNHGYHKVLYGDSVLQLEKTVSFKDANSTYRKRIVTSQRELKDASVRINENNKNRNLLDAKTIAVGLSDFIAERAQEELNLTFFNRFKKNLEKESELTKLFPYTRNLLQRFEISNYKTLLSHARESFTTDLENLGLNFPEILELPKYKKLYNSPEVFNLSLIYSIANLAYKEEPVERILLSSFQKLDKRKNELNKSINIQLADIFEKPINPKTEKPKNPNIIRGSERDTLKKLVEVYINSVKTCYDQLYEENNSLARINFDYSNELRGLPQRMGITNESIRPFESQIITYYNSHMDYFRILSNAFYREITFNNRKIWNRGILGFYKNTILTNLDKKQYYDYIIENPRVEDFDLYFNTQPDSINEILARGLDGSRALLAEDFSTQFDQTFRDLDFLSREYRRIKTEILTIEKANTSREAVVRDISLQIQMLENAINREASFWKKVTSKDKTDHYIAGFYFLKSILEIDPYVSAISDLRRGLDANINLDTLINTYYGNTFKKNYSGSIEEATYRLDSFQMDFENQIQTLQRVYGKIPVDAIQYEYYKNNSNYKMDSLLLEAQLFDLISQGFLLMETTDKNQWPEKAQQDQIMEKIFALQDELETESDPSKIATINAEITQLSTLNDTLSTKLGNLVSNQPKVLANYAKRDSIRNELIVISEDYQLVTPIKSTDAKQIKSLKDFYKITDNNFLTRLKELKEDEKTIDAWAFQDLDDQDKRMVSLKKQVALVKTNQNSLQNFITALENEYCKDLVEAENNAKNLSKSIELAAHLLFAFRTYDQDKIVVPIYTYDTSKVVVTINQFDSSSALVGKTYTADSLDIDRQMIEGTNEPIKVARWLTRKEFEALRKDEVQWNIFLGLIYQRLRSVEGAPNFTPEGIALLATKFLSLTHEMDTYREQLRIKKLTTPDQVSFKDYYPFIRSTVDLFNTVIQTQSIGTKSLSDNYPTLELIPFISNEALSLYENIYVKDYGNAILNAMELLKIISANKLNNKERGQSQRAINAVLTYGTFMAEMINAESSQQVQTILKSTTLPPGSSRIKRETITSFTINSYLGVAAGRDRLLNVPDNLDLAQDAFGASLAVPIGLTYSFSPSFLKRNSSFSIHIPLLDLGAITAYRQNPNNTNYSIDNLPDFSWNNLFSPGLFAVYNFSNSPFSLGVGGQYGPQLREIKFNTGEAVNVNSWRFPMAFFTIDVPFFNLHTGARKIIVK